MKIHACWKEKVLHGATFSKCSPPGHNLSNVCGFKEKNDIPRKQISCLSLTYFSAIWVRIIFSDLFSTKRERSGNLKKTTTNKQKTPLQLQANLCFHHYIKAHLVPLFFNNTLKKCYFDVMPSHCLLISRK